MVRGWSGSRSRVRINRLVSAGPDNRLSGPLSYLDDVIILDVRDNGVGLASSHTSPLSGGFGLESIRQRVTQRGGVLTLESEPGEGTALAATIPLRESPPSTAAAERELGDR